MGEARPRPAAIYRLNGQEGGESMATPVRARTHICVSAWSEGAEHGPHRAAIESDEAEGEGDEFVGAIGWLAEVEALNVVRRRGRKLLVKPGGLERFALRVGKTASIARAG